LASPRKAVPKKNSFAKPFAVAKALGKLASPEKVVPKEKKAVKKS